MDGAGIFLVQGGDREFPGRLGDYTATSPDFSSSTVGLLWFAPVRPYIRELGDGDRFSPNLRLAASQ